MHLWQRGFVGLVTTQFLGAANDNLLKGILVFAVALSGIWENALGDGGQAYVSLCLTLPFIFFSGWAGQIADRTNKQKVTVVVKTAELGIAAVAMAGFWWGNIWVALLSMLLLAIQSAFFGPAKYGMIPELVQSRDLSRANGVINMLTNLAVIAGTLAAGPIYQAYYPASDPKASATDLPEALLWMPGLAIGVLAVLGLLAAWTIPPLKARDPDLKFNWNPVGTYAVSLREMAQSALLPVAVSWAFFYLIGMMALLILPDYKALLAIDPKQASYLLGLLGLAIGTGSILAGLISGHHIDPRLIPVGAGGMTLFFFLLGIAPLKYAWVAVLLSGAGLFAGFYIIPLQSLLQYLSPESERGRFLGTANALSFVASTLGTLIFLGARRMGLPANRIFLICAGLAAIGTAVLLWRIRGLITDPKIRSASAKS